MSKIETKLCELLVVLSGQNYVVVFSARETSRAIFGSISRDAREFLRKSTARDLQKTLESNCVWLKEDRDIPHSSVFVCCDLFSTQSVVSYVTPREDRTDDEITKADSIRPFGDTALHAFYRAAKVL